MSGTATVPPRAIMSVLDVAIDALLGGSHGWLHIPPGGYLNVTWLSKKKCYRLTIDVTADHPFDDMAESFWRETRDRIAALPGVRA